jgi:DNA gyrase/topoisomerase IV subunit B
VTDAILAIYNKVLLTRTTRMAAWFNDTVKVYYNDLLIPVSNLLDYAKVIATSMTIQPKYINLKLTKQKLKTSIIDAPYQLNLVVMVKPFDTGFESFSIINGIVTNAQVIIEPLRKTIIDKVMIDINSSKLFNEQKTGVKLQRKYIQDILFMFVATLIPNPQWSSQTKDSIPATTASPVYVINDDEISLISTAVKYMIKEYILPELYSNAVEKPSKKKVVSDKYIPAKKAGTKDASKCYLISRRRLSQSYGCQRIRC